MQNQIIQLLASGKALCASNFPLFVDAWNWLSQAVANLRGDYDLAPDQGFVTVEDSLGFPVIRLTNLDKLVQAIGANTTINGLSGDVLLTGDDGVVVETDSVTNSIGVSLDSSKVVKSVNGAVNTVAIIGGKYIRVETSGNTIKITYDATKTTEDADPNAETTSPCDHPGGGSGSEGGVAPGDSDFDSSPTSDDGSGGSGGSGGGTVSGGGGGAGGVEAGGDVHAGDPCTDCTTN